MLKHRAAAQDDLCRKGRTPMHEAMELDNSMIPNPKDNSVVGIEARRA